MSDDKPCQKCEHYGGIAWKGPHTFCLHTGVGRMVQARPETGCAFYERKRKKAEDCRAAVGMDR